MRHVVIAASLALASGCASLEPPPAMPMLSSSRNPEFTPVFGQMTAQQTTYLEMARRLLGEAGFGDGLAVTAQIATLGFATFKAHADNTAAAAIVSGVTTTTRDRLSPRATAQFYLRGATALTCVADYANTLTYVPPGDRVPVTDNAVRTNALPPTSVTYVALQLALRGYLGEAAEIAQPSPALKAAISDAQNADQHLSMGIEAQVNALNEVISAKNAIHAAVEKRQIPDIKTVLEDITKIKIPAPPTSASTGTGTNNTKAGMLMQGKDKSAFTRFLADQDAADKRLVGLLSAMSTIIKSIRPERDAEVISKIKLCVVGFDPPPKPAG